MDDGSLLPAPPQELLPNLEEANERLEGSVDGLDDQDFAAPSSLPGWTRGHVVAHLILNAEGFVSVTHGALAGEMLDVYPGGRAARDAAIERGSSMQSNEAFERLRDAQAELVRLWRGLDEDGWRRRVRFKDGTMRHLLAARWREVEIHHSDLEVGYPPSRWTPMFSEHVVDFLLPRLSAAGNLELVATDTGRQWRLGAGGGTELAGKAYELAAWLAGRSAADPLGVVADDAPELGPWP